MIPHAKPFPESILKSVVIFLLLIEWWGLSCNGQEDTVRTLKNTVLINVSNPLIFGSRYKVIGYERVIKDYQTAFRGYWNIWFFPNSKILVRIPWA